jgi:phosphoadenosine phosphosulfate reductase
MDKSMRTMPLEEKEIYSRKIIRESYDRYGSDNAIAFSGGKDSTTLLHLVRSEFKGTIPWKVFTLDTGAEFPEITAFIKSLEKEWGLELITLRNEKVNNSELAKDKAECCFRRKALPINTAIKNYAVKGLMTAVRWDEQEARANETFFAERADPPHMRIQPILHFREIDIWSYLRKYEIPYCELYKKGYRSIDCIPCTKPQGLGGSERGGRDQNKEEAMKRLRSMGYF